MKHRGFLCASFVFDGIRCPALEETQHFFLIVALSFFQETGILNVDDLAFFIKDDEDREAETSTIIQSLHQGFCLLDLYFTSGLLGVVVHMDILKVVLNDFADGAIVHDKSSKPQAPRAPIATNLADDELSLRLRLDERLIYLFQWVDVLIIYFFQACLGIARGEEDGHQQNKKDSFHIIKH